MSLRERIANHPDLLPGTWRLSTANHPVVRCPECERAIALVLHTIKPDGVVLSAVSCSGCFWGAWLILDGWAHGSKAAGAPIATPSPRAAAAR